MINYITSPSVLHSFGTANLANWDQFLQFAYGEYLKLKGTKPEFLTTDDHDTFVERNSLEFESLKKGIKPERKFDKLRTLFMAYRGAEFLRSISHPYASPSLLNFIPLTNIISVGYAATAISNHMMLTEVGREEAADGLPALSVSVATIKKIAPKTKSASILEFLTAKQPVSPTSRKKFEAIITRIFGENQAAFDISGLLQSRPN